jgi:hypothetical protein
MLISSTSRLQQQSGIRRVRKMDLKMDLNVPAVGGIQWTMLEDQCEKNFSR